MRRTEVDRPRRKKSLRDFGMLSLLAKLPLVCALGGPAGFDTSPGASGK